MSIRDVEREFGRSGQAPTNGITLLFIALYRGVILALALNSNDKRTITLTAITSE